MKKLGVAGWALAALVLTASNASAEIITLRCTLNWQSLGTVEVAGVVLDTELRSVRYDGEMHTADGYVDGQLTRGKVARFDNERIEFGIFRRLPAQSWIALRSIDRITGTLTYYSDSGDARASGSCERAQAAF